MLPSAPYIRARCGRVSAAANCDRTFEMPSQYCNSRVRAQIANNTKRVVQTYVPLMVRDVALQLVKLQFEKTAEIPETIVSPADADEFPSKEFELHTCGWTTKDTPPPYTWGTAVSLDTSTACIAEICPYKRSKRVA